MYVVYGVRDKCNGETPDSMGENVCYYIWQYLQFVQSTVLSLMHQS